MKETRAAKYGRNLAVWVNHTIHAIPAEKRTHYRSRFVQEIRKYSFEPKRKDAKPNSGCTYELRSIEHCNVSNPWDLAKLVKEGIHLMYQKNTAKRVIDSLLENI
jgi:hypothetical protein